MHLSSDPQLPIVACSLMACSFLLSAGAAEQRKPQNLPDITEKMARGLDIYPKSLVDQIAARRAKTASDAAAKAAADAARGDFPSLAPEELRWRFVTTVTVAFNGGNETSYKLVEKAAREWTDHLPHFKLDFRTPDGHFRHWSVADDPDHPAADVRISFGPGTIGPWWARRPRPWRTVTRPR